MWIPLNTIPLRYCFAKHIGLLRNSRFLQGQYSLRIVLDLFSGESKPMETL